MQKINISGKLTNGEGDPLPNCMISLVASNVSKSVMKYTDVKCTTDKSGNYSMSVEPCTYQVFIKSLSRYEIGEIRVYCDSKDGTLNDFLICPRSCDLTPEILHIFNQTKVEVEELVKRAEKAAEKSEQALSEFKALDAPKDGKIYCRSNGAWVEIESSGSSTRVIDLTALDERLSCQDYVYRNDINDFSDMMLDYLRRNEVKGFNANYHYIIYVPGLDIQDTTELEPVSESNINEREFYEFCGFYDEKIRTAHVISKVTNKVVAQIKYIGGDDQWRLWTDNIERVSTRIKPHGTDKQYYNKMLNHGLKYGATSIVDGVEVEIIPALENEDELKYLKLMNYPFDEQKMPLLFNAALYDNEEISTITFYYTLDFPTGCLEIRLMYCYGEHDWDLTK